MHSTQIWLLRAGQLPRASIGAPCGATGLRFIRTEQNSYIILFCSVHHGSACCVQLCAPLWAARRPGADLRGCWGSDLSGLLFDLNTSSISRPKGRAAQSAPAQGAAPLCYGLRLDRCFHCMCPRGFVSPPAAWDALFGFAQPSVFDASRCLPGYGGRSARHLCFEPLIKLPGWQAQ
jgi:hypothetical protein